jgi:hypothetical protein
MPTTPFHTWKSHLPKNPFDTRIFLSKIDERATPHATTSTSTTESLAAFTPPEWYPGKLPSRVHLVNDLPFKMYAHLPSLLDHKFYASRVVQTHYTDEWGVKTSPSAAFCDFKSRCETTDFTLNCESGANMVAEHLSELVQDICRAVTGTSPLVDDGGYTKRHVLATDLVYKRFYEDYDREEFDRDWIHILWANKSPEEFNHFVGNLMDQLRARGSSGIDPCPELSPTKYDGYQAMLAKVRVLVAGCHQPTHL